LYMLFPRLTTNTERSITLSQEQFSRSTEQFIYSRTTADTSGNEHERCPIGFDEFIEGERVTKILHCGHVFKTVPLNDWFTRSSTCPVCRYDLHTNTTYPTSIDL
jgi:hypothetical protein